MVISEDIISILACPVCKHELQVLLGECVCTNEECRNRFPLVGGRPILLNEDNSVFQIGDYRDERPEDTSLKGRLKEAIVGFPPALTKNWVAEDNYARFREQIRECGEYPNVLLVGGGEV